MPDGTVAALNFAVAGVALVFGALGAALGALTLLRGAPARLEAATRDSVARCIKVEAEWGAMRSELVGLLDSIHTERENVKVSAARLSARTRQDAIAPVPETRDGQLHQLRKQAGLT